MNKEIKRILKELKDNYEELGVCYYPNDVLEPKDTKIIYDYIIELQQENKQLKNNIRQMDDSVDKLQKLLIKEIKECLKDVIVASTDVGKEFVKTILNIMQELEQGSDSNE